MAVVHRRLGDVLRRDGLEIDVVGEEVLARGDDLDVVWVNLVLLEAADERRGVAAGQRGVLARDLLPAPPCNNMR